MLTSCGFTSNDFQNKKSALNIINDHGGLMISDKDQSMISLATVAIEISGSNPGICSGVVIKQRTVLTAAHCLQNVETQYISVIFSNAMYKKPVKRIKASKIYIHEKVSRLGTEDSPIDDNAINDVAIIQLEENASNKGGAPVTPYFLIKNFTLPLGSTVTAAGYGFNENGDVGYLKSLIMKVSGVNKGNFDVTHNSGGICGGDSGGPIYYYTNEGKYLLIGLISKGRSDLTENCSKTMNIMNIGENQKWILEHANK